MNNNTQEMITITLKEYEELKQLKEIKSKFDEILITPSVHSCSNCGCSMVELVDNSPWMSILPRPKVFQCSNPNCETNTSEATTTTNIEYKTR